MPEDTPPSLPEDEQKAVALDAILSAWDVALARGVEPTMLASTAIFAALTDMVDQFGEEAVAALCAELPERVLRGEFSFPETPEDPGPA
jgi:hypothetical protein